jgi:hypothetical protein
MMNKIAELAEQYIRESELHLAHIDALIARAAKAAAPGEAAAETDALLKRMQRDRDRLAQELEGLRRLPPEHGTEVIREGEKLTGVLQAVGLQFEKVLGAVLEHGKRRGSGAH